MLKALVRGMGRRWVNESVDELPNIVTHSGFCGCIQSIGRRNSNISKGKWKRRVK
jgi:hypothetical protein